jgi:uncharacterized membrane protein YphA (DoxX/SURF4 family)
VVLLVALRLALGWHFLYEGMWKINHPKEFTAEAEGFLAGARGPLAGVFYAMVPDIDGRTRLAGVLKKDVETPVPDAAGKMKKTKVDRVENEARTRRWAALRDRLVARAGDLRDRAVARDSELSDAAEKAFQQQLAAAEKIFQEHMAAAEMYLAENWKDIQTHFAALDRFEAERDASPRTAFQTKRNWDEMRKLRGEAKVWLAALDEYEEAYKTALARLVDEDASDAFALGWNPLRWPRMEQVCFALRWGLTAIGLCLLVGLAARPAALAGGLFMLAVVLSQPSFPGVVPADPPRLGHALLVNKDFVEMLALWLLATTAVGRWGGLDWFVHRFITEPFLAKSVGGTAKKK